MVNTGFEGKSALDLFPDLSTEAPKKSKSGIPIPQPPDTSWLAKGFTQADTGVTSDSLTALIVIFEDNNRILVEKILSEMGYNTTIIFTGAQAIEKLELYNYNLVICGEGSAFEEIHRNICGFSPAKRRAIYYAVVGRHRHTLYDLEALALSANLVINDNDLHYLKKILSKGLDDYEKLFRPLLDVLSASNSSL